MSKDPWRDLSASLAALRKTHDSALMAAQAADFSPVAGSPAALECATEPLAGPWGDTPTADANTSVLLQVTAAMDHLLGLETLLTGPSLYAPFTVARSVIDIASQAWHQLEPGIGGKERALRHINSRLRSLWEQTKLVEDDSRAEAQKIRNDAQQRINVIVSCAQMHHLAVRSPNDRRRAPTVGTPLKSTTVLANACVSDTVPNLGAAFWRFTSAITHGQAHGLMSAFAPTEGGSLPGAAVGQLQISAKDVAIRAAGAPLAVISMLQRLYAHFGWPVGDLDRSGHRLVMVWARVGEVTIPAQTLPGQRVPGS
ncbi:hypothetical protein [Streptomyces sp. NPDC005078]|uniref:hypothetical protein n=1 Tax=Streptomyces sp. NPDC005078 TaxID=3154293 RepID=UPI0033B9C8F6